MINRIIPQVKGIVISHKFYLGLAIIIGSFIRLFGLDIQSLWLDELYSVTAALSSENVSQLYHIWMINDPHPPLYQLFMFYWIRIIGDSEVMVRLPSALAGILTIIMIYIYAKPFWGKYVATSAALLVSLTFPGIYYAQEARSYSVLMLLSTVSLFLWLRLISDETVNKNKELIKYVVTIILLSFIHYFGLLLAMFQLIYWFLCFLYYKKPVRNPIIAAIFLTLAYIPWLPAMFSRLAAGPIWITSPDIFFFARFVGTLLYPATITLILLLLLVVPLIIERKAFTFNFQQVLGDKIRFDSPILALFLLTFLITFFSFAFSQFVPILTPKNLLILSPAAYILIAVWVSSISMLKNLKQNMAVFVIFLTAFLSFSPVYYSPHKEQWREAVHFTLEDAKEHSLIVMTKPAAPYFEYYFKRAGGYEKDLYIIEAGLYDDDFYFNHARENNIQTIYILLAHWRYKDEDRIVDRIKAESVEHTNKGFIGAKVHRFTLF